jgi:hypothetical protein
MKRAIIFKPSKSATQSGTAKTKHWMLEYLPENSREIDPVMGWTGNSDMHQSQIKLKFDSKEEALEYAKLNGVFVQEVIEPQVSAPIIKNYVDNYKYRP